MEIANKVKDLKLETKIAGVYERLDDVTQFATPDVEFGEGELTGAGLGGALNIPDIYNISAMVASITSRSLKERHASTLSPEGAEFRASWVVDNVGATASISAFSTYVAVIKGNASSIPGLEIEKGNAMEAQTEYAVWYYKLTFNGKTMFEIDIINGVLVINGVDYGAKLREALNQA